MSSKKAKKYESPKKDQKRVKKDGQKGKKKQKKDDNEESLAQLYALVAVLLCGLAGVSIYLLTPPKMSPHEMKHLEAVIWKFWNFIWTLKKEQTSNFLIFLPIFKDQKLSLFDVISLQRGAV